MEEMKKGFRDGIPIALGYFAVSFSVGIMVISGNISILQGCIMSLTNVTSAGQFAGIRIIAAGGTLVEMAMTMFIINLRYALMSLSLSQKISPKVKWWQRLLIAYANTDEIFAVAMNHQKELTFPYMFGLQSLPVFGWTFGTFLGGVACELMPPSLRVAMNVMLYGMFIAIVVPVAKKEKAVLFVSLFAILFSCIFTYLPLFHGFTDGISIILCTVAAASIGAVLWPVGDRGEAEKEKN